MNWRQWVQLSQLRGEGLGVCLQCLSQVERAELETVLKQCEVFVVSKLSGMRKSLIITNNSPTDTHFIMIIAARTCWVSYFIVCQCCLTVLKILSNQSDSHHLTGVGADVCTKWCFDMWVEHQLTLFFDFQVQLVKCGQKLSTLSTECEETAVFTSCQRCLNIYPRLKGWGYWKGCV